MSSTQISTTVYPLSKIHFKFLNIWWMKVRALMFDFVIVHLPLSQMSFQHVSLKTSEGFLRLILITYTNSFSVMSE